MTVCRTVWINGRFLTRRVTGVERVAHSVLRALGQGALDARGGVERDGLRLQFQLAVPTSAQAQLPARLGNIPVVGVGRWTGHLWEQLVLARLPRVDWLLSLCNTGPLLRREHGLMFHDAQVYAIPRNFGWRFRLWYRALLQVAGRRAGFLLTNSHFSGSELARYTGIGQERFTVMHLGCDHLADVRAALPADLAAQLPDRPFVLAVSSVNPNKNFSAVIEALALLGPDAPPCVIVGQRNDHVFGRASLDARRVIWLGYVSDEALAALYQRALCLVFPSFYEGFGLPPLEAMAQGCPVIVSQTSSLPEVCGDAALYCDPARPATLAAAIRSLVDQPGLADRLKALGRTRAAGFTWHAAADRLLDRLFAAVRGQTPVHPN
jgi:glycosyltransferase involved in cell wall biosynthesis